MCSLTIQCDISSDNRKRAASGANDKTKKKTKEGVVKKVNSTLAQRIEILNWHNSNGQNQRKTAEHFDKIYPQLRLKQPRISDWVKGEEKMRQEYESGVGINSKRAVLTEHPQVSQALEIWVSQAEHAGLVLTGDAIRAMWKRFADLFNIPDEDRLHLSEGWLSCFKKRNGLGAIKRHGEAGAASSETVAAERKRVRAITDLYHPSNIFNMDETGLFYG